jgi:hypothetical protein
MRKLAVCLALASALLLVFSIDGWSRSRTMVIKVGLNVPITGDIPKVGEGSTKPAVWKWVGKSTRSSLLSKTMNPRPNRLSKPVPR